jgi:catechol 2,3-dioxygenase-like lactoylglutathione lyase family enzyme
MTRPLFERVQLETHRLDAQKEFYACHLGLPLVAEQADRFAVQAGATVLEFVETEPGNEPCYHIAFNIPENQIEVALVWVRERAPIPLKRDGESIYEFETWRAQAFYFFDPAGNLLELIARHTMENASREAFGPGSFLCVSEVGVATEEVRATSIALIEALELKCYPDPSTQPGEDFQALGNENGLFVVARRGRTWLGSDRSAQTFRSKVQTTKSVQLQLTDTHAIIC